MIGALLVDKPAGLTSHDVVRRVRKAVGTRAVGHTGTLDPFATGLLVVLVGRATRLARFVERQDKTYAGTLRLGVVTDTDDLTGEVVSRVEREAWPAAAEMAAALAAVVGDQLQVPPAYSAKKVDGVRSHRLARKGAPVELAPVPVTVRKAELVRYDAPLAEFRVVVSAGTYVRALARDIGAALGTGAHLTALRREAIGALDVANAVPLDEVGPGMVLLPPQAVLRHLAARELDDLEAGAVRHGRALADTGGLSGDVMLLKGGELLAVARAAAGRMQPAVVLADA